MLSLVCFKGRCILMGGCAPQPVASTTAHICHSPQVNTILRVGLQLAGLTLLGLSASFWQGSVSLVALALAARLAPTARAAVRGAARPRWLTPGRGRGPAPPAAPGGPDPIEGEGSGGDAPAPASPPSAGSSTAASGQPPSGAVAAATSSWRRKSGSVSRDMHVDERGGGGIPPETPPRTPVATPALPSGDPVHGSSMELAFPATAGLPRRGSGARVWGWERRQGTEPGRGWAGNRTAHGVNVPSTTSWAPAALDPPLGHAGKVLNEETGQLIGIGKATYNRLLEQGYLLDADKGVITPPPSHSAGRSGTRRLSTATRRSSARR